MVNISWKIDFLLTILFSICSSSLLEGLIASGLRINKILINAISDTFEREWNLSFTMPKRN